MESSACISTTGGTRLCGDLAQDSEHSFTEEPARELPQAAHYNRLAAAARDETLLGVSCSSWSSSAPSSQAKRCFPHDRAIDLKNLPNAHRECLRVLKAGGHRTAAGDGTARAFLLPVSFNAGGH